MPILANTVALSFTFSSAHGRVSSKPFIETEIPSIPNFKSFYIYSPAVSIHPLDIY
jgi:hypothetical protein